MDKEEPRPHHTFCNYWTKDPSETCKQCIMLYEKYGEREISEIMKTDFPNVIIRK